EDGSRVFGSKSKGSGGLWMRDLATEKTVRLDVSEPGAVGGEGKPIFQTASRDGSRVFFTDAARLTTDSTAGTSPDLYEYDVETGKLVDLSVDPHVGQEAGVPIVLAASEDGSYVYFAASGALAPPAVPGDCESEERASTCNLYVRHNGTTKFLAALSGADASWKTLYNSDLLNGANVRVSPDGQWFAFMSNRSVTGYDNRDARSGRPDEEVFLYNAGTEHIVCASCEPTGARPVGVFVKEGVSASETPLLVNPGHRWQGADLAATVPGWAGVTSSNSYYQPRYLSDGGRLFFNSDGALVPQDTDGTWDVYEYEPPGAGNCGAASATFSEASGGCVGLISSGGAREESVFMDASENGDDVFFLTGAGLVSQDYDGALDLYDAHACSSASPCLPVAPVVPPPCSTGDACKAAPSPQPEAFGAPPSQTFSGAGNITTAGEAHSVRPRSLTRTQKLAGALRACHKKKAKAKRRACERQAHKRYGKTARSAAPKSVSHRAGR
ncbi:MAG: hypothetical protein WAN93_08805, partial [Solirubrobacteraceae bacterium]